MPEPTDPGAPVPTTVFDVVGRSFFIDLVDDFYRRVAADPVLRPSYPDDLTESRRTLAWFLIQYWGGPTDYSDERGHPRLRMRHAPFVIGQRERDAWLEHMTAAVAASDAPDEVAQLLDRYFEQASTAMINQAL
ncbi:MAG: globin [Actinomycetota bacterium]